MTRTATSPSAAPSEAARPGAAVASRLAARRAARVTALGWGVVLLAACGDPGSGGTGVPSAAAPTAPAPVAAPAPTTSPGDPASPVADLCAAPAAASAEPFSGRVSARSDRCLVVDGRAIRIGDASLQRRSGAAATVDDLVTGVRVTVVPDPGDAGRAVAVTIEDVGT